MQKNQILRNPAIKSYIRVRCEETPNNSQIAGEVIKRFKLDAEREHVRVHVSKFRAREKIQKTEKPRRRLFFDIETSYATARVWRPGKQYVNPENLITDTKIICISYKWQGEDKVHHLHWDKNQNDGTMLKKFVKIMGDADEIVAHNGDNFDMKVFRTRCIINKILMYPTYRTFDTLKKARQYFSFSSNKLDYIGKVLGVGRKLTHEGMKMWVDVVEGKCEKALKKMLDYCDQDIILLEDVFNALNPYVYHNTNFAVLHGKDKWDCPDCTSTDVDMYHTYTTPMGVIRRNMRCNDCFKQYRISNKTYTQMLVSNHDR